MKSANPKIRNLEDAIRLADSLKKHWKNTNEQKQKKLEFEFTQLKEILNEYNDTVIGKLFDKSDIYVLDDPTELKLKVEAKLEERNYKIDEARESWRGHLELLGYQFRNLIVKHRSKVVTAASILIFLVTVIPVFVLTLGKIDEFNNLRTENQDMKRELNFEKSRSAQLTRIIVRLEEDSRQQLKLIQDISEDRPIPSNPSKNKAIYNDPAIKFRWQSKAKYSEYVIELAKMPDNFDSNYYNVLVDGSKSISEIVISDFKQITQGDSEPYLWRVRPGRYDGSGFSHYAPWGPYEQFTIYENSIDKILKTKKLRFGFQPGGMDDFNKIGKNSKWEGKDQRIAEIIIEYLNNKYSNCKDKGRKNCDKIELERIQIPFDGLLEAVRSGDVEIALSAITKTPERRSNTTFSLGYLPVDQVFISSLRDITKNIVDHSIFKNRNIAAQFKTTNAESAKVLVDRLESEGIVLNLYQDYSSTEEIVYDLSQKRIDFAIIDRPLAFSVKKIYPRIMILPESYNTWLNQKIVRGDDKYSYYAVAAVDSRLVSEINCALHNIYSNTDLMKDWEKEYYGENHNALENEYANFSEKCSDTDQKIDITKI